MMCDITRLKEVCRDYSETSDRVSKSLLLLKHELRSLRQQDVMLLKQLVSINDVISGIKLSHQQRSGSPATLPRSSPSAPSTTLKYTLSLRRPAADATRPARFSYGAQTAGDATGHQHARAHSPFLWQASCLPRNSSGSPHRENCNRIEEKMTNSRCPSVWRCSGTGITSVDIRNDYNKKSGCVHILTDEIPSRNSSGRTLEGGVDAPKLRDSLVLRSSTTSIDTLQSQADSMYGSGSDLRTSSDSLHMSGHDPEFPLSSGIEDNEIIIV